MPAYSLAACSGARCQTKAALVALLVLLVTTHTLIIPSLIGYYGEDCHLSATRYQAYRLLFQRIVTLYDTLNQTYWVDHGLLLGYFRGGDMLPHDGDIDISRLFTENSREYWFDKNFQKLMASYPETTGNAMVAKMNYSTEHGERVCVEADLFRYEVKEIEGKKRIVEHWNEHHRNTSR